MMVDEEWGREALGESDRQKEGVVRGAEALWGCRSGLEERKKKEGVREKEGEGVT